MPGLYDPSLVSRGCLGLGYSDYGCGKTFLYNTLIAQLRHEKRSVIACASTGIAALLLMGGRTAHRAFRIPEDVSRDMPPRYAWETDDSKRIRDAEVLIIDEVSMLHRDVLDFINRTLQDLQPTDEPKMPFGGKVVILGGDWKQLLPVVPGINIIIEYQISNEQI